MFKNLNIIYSGSNSKNKEIVGRSGSHGKNGEGGP